ncbi:MAG: glycosyltransferase [Oscillospiraceae bacterium]|nr:glycosyltransferase [Oscillospiraceae bacterium]
MILKTAVKKITDAFSESIYLRKSRRNIRKNTVYCPVSEIKLSPGLKRVKSPVNAQYIVTDSCLPHRFIKKSGQTVAVICRFAHTEFFGEFQRTILMADYLVCPENQNAETLLDEFEVNGIFKGQVIHGYDENLFENIVNGRYRKSTYKKRKKNVLIYSGSLAQNGLTASLMNLLSCLKDDTDTDYMITYRENSLRNSPERLEKIPEQFRRIPIAGGFCPSVSELICYLLYFKLNVSWKPVAKRLDRFFKREWRRLFGGIDVDTAIQFSGYEYGVIKLFQQSGGKRIIFVHNDMVSEIKYRHNQHRLTLKEAYRSYDVVALVTEDMKESTLEISGTDKNMTVIPNCHDYRSVIEKSLMPPEFQPETECNISLKELTEILDSDMDKFITIGRFSPEKAHLRLIDAFSDYCRLYPDRETCLIIIGGRGELYEQTVKYAEKTGLKIVLIRSMENPMPVLKKCSLFMLPSEYEGLGLVLLEADTLGIPVFATDIPGPRCFLKQYGGLLTENSREGILKGMRYYNEGKIQPLNIDYEKYNQLSAERFKNIL